MRADGRPARDANACIGRPGSFHRKAAERGAPVQAVVRTRSPASPRRPGPPHRAGLAYAADDSDSPPAPGVLRLPIQ